MIIHAMQLHQLIARSDGCKEQRHMAALTDIQKPHCSHTSEHQTQNLQLLVVYYTVLKKLN